MGCMTREDTKALIQLLQIHCPSFANYTTVEEMKTLVDLWHKEFENEDTSIVRYAAEKFIKENPYPPKPANIQAEIRKIQNAVDEDTIEQTIADSWMVICGNKDWEELSDLAKAYWGCKKIVEAVGYDPNTSYSVIAGEMQRRLPAIKERLQIQRETPPQIKDLVRKSLPGLKLIGDGNGDN